MADLGLLAGVVVVVLGVLDLVADLGAVTPDFVFGVVVPLAVPKKQKVINI